jgi:hypothetical protein
VIERPPVVGDEIVGAIDAALLERLLASYFAPAAASCCGTTRDAFE